MRSLLFKYNPKLKDRARKLRKSQTDAELLLWLKLRNNQLGYKFRRQFPIGIYILDFYCDEKRLAIELDGGQHNILKQKEYDRIRTENINQYGIKLIRFWDNEVLKNIDGVLEKILDNLND
jgi:very-short-patch-repair endonuclease